MQARNAVLPAGWVQIGTEIVLASEVIAIEKDQSGEDQAMLWPTILHLRGGATLHVEDGDRVAIACAIAAATMKRRAPAKAGVLE
ncbi:MAG: hypothetical protein WAT39_23965 [Planctomycetota bacterium]